MNRLVTVIVVALSGLLCCTRDLAAQNLLITNARIITGTGAVIDRGSVVVRDGRIVSVAAWEGKESRPDLTLGVCGEHGGDPASIHFFETIQLDYVSCSPFRVPVARLETARAHLLADEVSGAGGTA